jgi:hypothetical protein
MSSMSWTCMRAALHKRSQKTTKLRARAGGGLVKLEQTRNVVLTGDLGPREPSFCRSRMLGEKP